MPRVKSAFGWTVFAAAMLAILTVSRPSSGVAGSAIEQPPAIGAGRVIVYASYAALPTCNARSVNHIATATYLSGAADYLCNNLTNGADNYVWVWMDWHWVSDNEASPPATVSGSLTYAAAAAANSILTLPPCAVVGFASRVWATANNDATYEAQIGGTNGNSITVTTVGDSGAGVTISTVGYAVTIHYQSGVSTRAGIQAALAAVPAASQMILATGGVAAGALVTPGDDAGPLALSGGVDLTEPRVTVVRTDAVVARTLQIVAAAAGQTIGGTSGTTGILLVPGQQTTLACTGGVWSIEAWTEGTTFALAGAAAIPAGTFNVGLTAGGAVAPPLPACAGAMVGRTVGIKLLDANAATITRAGADTIDGAATYLMNVQYQFTGFHCASAGVWYIR